MTDCPELTVFDNSLPDSMILRQSGMISVVSKKFITSGSSVCEKGGREMDEGGREMDEGGREVDDDIQLRC